MQKVTAAQAVKTAIRMKGMPYWYACSGQRPTEQLLNSLINGQFQAKWTPARIAKARAEAGKFDHCFDCIGFIRYCSGMQNNRDALYTNADGLRMISDPQPISTLPEIPGVCLFMKGHVGLYIGGGRVMEAHGFKRVDNTPLSFQKWTHWGFAPWIDYGREKPTEGIRIGDRARIKSYGVPYYPGGVKIPDAEWLRGKVMTVNGLREMGGVPCARLAEITSWCACANLEKAED